MNELFRIRQKWFKHAPNEWWGDSVDVRFHLVSQLKKLRNQQILDVGCNIGIILTELDDSNNTYGFDINPDGLRIAKQLNKNAHLLRASVLGRFPYKEACFDVVIMANMIPYYDYSVPAGSEEMHAQINHVFKEVYRVLKVGGKLFLTTPNGEHFCYWHTKKIYSSDLQNYLALFNEVKIYGWNPLPSLVAFLPKSLKKQISPKFHKFLFIPSPLLARMPFIMTLIQFLSRKQFLLREAKAFYVECEK